ncbi:TPA: hypothetical protein SFZ51_000745 [Campylobacter jejuni]|nr:hypothetical protein [Campylobacter jejuni]HEG8104746.1 hypothetical protein [Campylobacter jejuni]HEG8133634.1 hypothetical protein [Campylobacter jejuni]
MKFLKKLFDKTKIRDINESSFRFDIDLDSNLTYMGCIPESSDNISMVVTYSEYGKLWREYSLGRKREDIFIGFNNYVVIAPIVEVKEPCLLITYEDLANFVRNSFEFEFEPELFNKIEQVLSKFDHFDSNRPITLRDLYYDEFNYHAYLFMKDNELKTISCSRYGYLSEYSRLMYGGSFLLEIDSHPKLSAIGREFKDRFLQDTDIRGYILGEIDKLGRVNKLTDKIYKGKYRIKSEEASREGLELYNSVYKGVENNFMPECPLDVKDLHSIGDIFKEFLCDIFLTAITTPSEWNEFANWDTFIRSKLNSENWKTSFFYNKNRVRIYGKYKFTQDDKYICHQSHPILIEINKGCDVKLIKVEVKDEWRLENKEFYELLQTIMGYYSTYGQSSIGTAVELKWKQVHKFRGELKENFKHIDEMVSKVISEILMN